MATFFAGRKLSRIGIDNERSTMSTVDDRSVPLSASISKSSGSRLHRRARTRPGDGVLHGALDVEGEGIAEFVRLGPAFAFVAGADEGVAVPGRLVPRQLREQLRQRPLPDPADRLRGQLVPALALLMRPASSSCLASRARR